MEHFYFQIVAAALFLLINTALYVFKPGGAAALTMVSNFSAIFSGLLATFACIYAVRSFVPGDRRRKGWLFWALGFSLYFLGELTWAMYEVFLKKPVPFPSLADAFWLVGYIPLLLGLLNGYRLLAVSLRTRDIVFLSLLLSMASLLVLAFVVAPVVKDGQISLLEKILGSAYPVGDLLLLAPVLAIMLQFKRSLLGKPWLYICLGFASFSIADSIFSYLTRNEIYQLGSFVDLLWLAGYLLIAMGASYQRIINQAGY